MKKAFNNKAMLRLKNIVGDWKEKWKFFGDEAKQTYLSNDVWTGLKAYWLLPKSVQRSLKCSAARLTRDAQGNLPIPHTSGQTPHAKRALQIVSFRFFLNFHYTYIYYIYIYNILLLFLNIGCQRRSAADSQPTLQGDPLPCRWPIRTSTSRADLQRCRSSDSGGPDSADATKPGWSTGPAFGHRTRPNFRAGKIFDLFNLYTCIYLFYICTNNIYL